MSSYNRSDSSSKPGTRPFREGCRLSLYAAMIQPNFSQPSDGWSSSYI
ncbi:hypothetical protein [uncultured Methanospirillum sp.]|nr:hypothetical protein [uncultured Methanospirillum sp.]